MVLRHFDSVAESLEGDGIVTQIFFKDEELDLGAFLLDLYRTVLHEIRVLYVYQDSLHMLNYCEGFIVVKGVDDSEIVRLR